MIKNIYEKFNIYKVGLAVLLLAVYCIGVTVSGGNILEILMFAIETVALIFLPGLFIYDNLDLSENFTEKKRYYSIVLMLGMAFLGLLFAICAYTEFWYALYVIPLIVDAMWLYRYGQERDYKKFYTPQNVWLFLVYACAIFMYTFMCVAKHAHPAQVGEVILTQDFMWTVGNAQSMLNSFPPMDIRFDGVILKYHYFTELLTAAISKVSAISSYNILGFYMQGFMMAFFILALKDFATIYYDGDELKTDMFVASFFALSCLSLWKPFYTGSSVFGNSMLEVILTNSNSQTTGLGLLAVLSMLTVNIARNKEVRLSYYMVVVISMVLLTFTKSPMAAIMALAIICALFVNFITRNEKVNISVLGIVTVTVFATIYFTFLSGGTGKSTMFSLTKTLELGYFRNYMRLFELTKPTLYKFAIPAFMLLQTFCIMPFQFVTVFPKMIKDLFRLFKLSFEKLLFYAAAVGGVLAYFLTYHEAYSQVYFLYVAIFFFNLLAIEYFDFTKLKIKNIVSYALIALSCFTTLVFYVNFGGSGLRQFAFHTNIIEKPEYRFVMKAEDENAGNYLRENMQDGELFITNRIHTGAGEGLSNVYTCFSGKQAYMEGFKYTVSNMGISWNEVSPRLKKVGKVFGINGERMVQWDEILEMCKEDNIRYVVYSSQFEGETEELEKFETVFDEGTVKIYKLY